MTAIPTISPNETNPRLIALRDKGLVALRVDDRDKRVKYVEPTSAAKDYMARIGGSLRAVNAPEVID